MFASVGLCWETQGIGRFPVRRRRARLFGVAGRRVSPADGRLVVRHVRLRRRLAARFQVPAGHQRETARVHRKRWVVVIFF